MDIKRIVAAEGWRLMWNARTSNMLADSFAEKSLASNCIFSFTSLNLYSIPADLENALITYMAEI